MDILNAIKDVDVKSLNRGKLKTRENKKYTYPVQTEILQNNPCYIIKEISKNKPPTIRKSREINENVCIIYRKLPVQRGQQESRAIGQKLSRDDNWRLRPAINVYFSQTLAMMPCGHPRTAMSPTW